MTGLAHCSVQPDERRGMYQTVATAVIWKTGFWANLRWPARPESPKKNTLRLRYSVSSCTLNGGNAGALAVSGQD
jgi:hypothetical protein